MQLLSDIDFYLCTSTCTLLCHSFPSSNFQEDCSSFMEITIKIRIYCHYLMEGVHACLVLSL